MEPHPPARFAAVQRLLGVPNQRLKSWLPLLKWVLLALIAYAALSLGETEHIREKIATFPFEGLLGFLALGLVSRLFYAWRWQTITLSQGISGLKLSYLFRVNLLSEFVSIVLPSYLGGEGVRLLKLRKGGGANRAIFVSLVLDRIVGVTTLLLLTALFLPVLLPYIPADLSLPPALLPLTVAILAFVLGVGVVWLRRRGSLSLPAVLQGLHFEPKTVLISVALSAVGHLVYATGYFVLFRQLIAVSYSPLMAVTFVALLTASVPLSLFGVDVSDGSIVVLAGLIAVQPDVAIVVVTLVVASRYCFSLCGLLLELIADGRQVFVRNTRQVPDIV